MITIAERILVPHSPQIVWEVLSDPATVVSCIEGSELGDEHDDGTFDARLAVKFAAIKVAFAARVSLELEDVERIGRMEARGADSRGSTRVQGRATFEVVPAPEGSEVVLDGAIELNGQLASLITTGATVVVDRMTRTFAENLSRTCAARDPETPVVVFEGPTSRGLRGWVRLVSQRIRDRWTARRSRNVARKANA